MLKFEEEHGYSGSALWLGYTRDDENSGDPFGVFAADTSGKILYKKLSNKMYIFFLIAGKLGTVLRAGWNAIETEDHRELHYYACETGKYKETPSKSIRKMYSLQANEQTRSAFRN